MIKQNKVIFTAIMIGIFFLLSVTASYSGLTMRYQRIIRVAYMNGFLEAARMDPEELNRIREETDLLKVGVERAAQMYIDKVENMNREKDNKGKAYKKY